MGPKMSCLRKTAIALYPSQLKPDSTRPVLLLYSAAEIFSCSLCLQFSHLRFLKQLLISPTVIWGAAYLMLLFRNYKVIFMV